MLKNCSGLLSRHSSAMRKSHKLWNKGLDWTESKRIWDPLQIFQSEKDLDTFLRSFFVFKSGSVGLPILSASALGESNKLKMAAKTWIFCSETNYLHLVEIHTYWTEKKEKREEDIAA